MAGKNLELCQVITQVQTTCLLITFCLQHAVLFLNILRHLHATSFHHHCLTCVAMNYFPILSCNLGNKVLRKKMSTKIAAVIADCRCSSNRLVKSLSTVLKLKPTCELYMHRIGVFSPYCALT